MQFIHVFINISYEVDFLNEQLLLWNIRRDEQFSVGSSVAGMKYGDEVIPVYLPFNFFFSYFPSNGIWREQLAWK